MALVLCPAIIQAAPADMGTYAGPGRADRIPAFENWFGHQVPRVVDFYSADSWRALTDNKWLLNSWKGKRWQVALSIGMLPSDRSGTLAQGAAGVYDAHWTNIAKKLVLNGYTNSQVIRLGWEFNGGWYAWAAKPDKTNWIAYWQRIVTIFRSIPGGDFKFDWNPACGWQQFPAVQVYPGDAYVDIIGLDVYNQSWIPNHTNATARWNDIYNGTTGVKWALDFAKQRGKPVSFPEWGTGKRPDGHGGGDDPMFVTNMFNVIRTNNVLYHNYWDFPASDYNAQLHKNTQPLAGAAFKELFGTLMPNATKPSVVK